MQKPEDTRRALYEEFRSLVERRDLSVSGNGYFDETALLDIYDYAADINDDFIRMEALFYGARMFPESEALMSRRDYFYYYLGNDDAATASLKRRPAVSTLSRLLELRIANPDDEKLIAELGAILGDSRGFDDEEVIRFVDACSSPAAYEWLIANFDNVKAKCSYLPSLYYEVAGLAEENGDLTKAIAMAEELTMLEPFNSEFWELLADLQFSAREFDDAVQSADYALAIDPESVRARIVKASALATDPANAAEAADMLMGVQDDERFDSMNLRLLALLLSNLSREDDALRCVEAFLRKHPDDFVALDVAFALAPARQLEWLDAFSRQKIAAEISSNIWVDWALRHMVQERYNIAAEILLLGRRLGSLRPEDHVFLLESLYAAKRYADIEKIFAAEEQLHTSAEVVLIMCLTYLRQGEKEKAYNLIVRMLAEEGASSIRMFSSNPASVSFYYFFNAGYRITLANMANLILDGKDFSVDMFDPFVH